MCIYIYVYVHTCIHILPAAHTTQQRAAESRVCRVSRANQQLKVPEKDTNALATDITLNCKKSHKMQYNVRNSSLYLSSFFVNLVKVPEKDTDAFATVIILNCKKSHKMQYNDVRNSSLLSLSSFFRQHGKSP